MTGSRLVLLRHGRTDWNAVGRAQGHADIELDDLGHWQAASAAAALAEPAPAALWTSDLLRARQTCAYLERVVGLCAKADDRLREFDVGVRQGMTMSELADAFPAQHAALQRGDDSVRVPGAETWDEVEARMVPVLRECLDSLAPRETGLVVTHGACLKLAVGALLGWARDAARSLRGVDNCGWVVLGEAGRGGRLRLEAYNRLAGPAGAGVTDL